VSKPAVPFSVTIEVRDACLCLHAQRAARALARRYDAALRPAGLTGGQFSILMSLNRPEPPLLGQVAELLAMDRTTLTANLKPLQRRGLVDVVADPQDRRGRRLVLTAAGSEALAAALPAWRRAQKVLARELGDVRLDGLLATLRFLA
jgi:DNA-binding MarR family transcriptional regulator